MPDNDETTSSIYKINLCHGAFVPAIRSNLTCTEFHLEMAGDFIVATKRKGNGTGYRYLIPMSNVASISMIEEK